ncbi:MAG: DNA alkylation repair protein [Clostridiales bacterium]|nr:DNA alkylation repair protein [Clostridiales bacterium]
MTRIQELLFELQDIKYADFQSNLTPTLSRERFIGVRTPELRALAKKLAAVRKIEEFMKELPHFYFEENQLHAFLIAEEKDFSVCLAELERFLPYIDNWATCDQLSPKVFKNCPERLLPDIECWLDSSHIYTVRFGIGMLMRYFLDDRFEVNYAKQVAAVPSDRAYFRCKWQTTGETDTPIGQRETRMEVQADWTVKAQTDSTIKEPMAGDRPYYISMMVAWYFATALAKQYDAILPFLEENKLDTWTHNKTIQKAVESYRILPERKAYLKTLKRPSH